MRENPAHQGIQLCTIVLRRPCGIAVPHACRCKKNTKNSHANPGREARAALQIIGKICAMRCLLIGPKILEARAAIGRESRFGDRVAEQSCGGFLFLLAGRVCNSACTIQMTEASMVLLAIDVFNICSSHPDARANRETPSYCRTALIFARPSEIVFKLVQHVGGQ